MGQKINKHSEEKIIERLRKLPPQQLDEVIQFIDFIAERHQNSAPVTTSGDSTCPIADLRGRGKGERLVERLLRSRREDQKYNERK